MSGFYRHLLISKTFFFSRFKNSNPPRQFAQKSCRRFNNRSDANGRNGRKKVEREQQPVGDVGNGAGDAEESDAVAEKVDETVAVAKNVRHKEGVEVSTSKARGQCYKTFLSVIYGFL